VTLDDFLLEHWKLYAAYMERKERLIEVGTTIYLAFVSFLLTRNDAFWRSWRDEVGSVVVLLPRLARADTSWHWWPEVVVLLALAAIVGLVLWFISMQMIYWTRGAQICNACQSLMTESLGRTYRLAAMATKTADLTPVVRKEFARVKLPKILVDEIDRRQPVRWFARLRPGPFELIVYGLFIVWTAALALRLWNVWHRIGHVSLTL